MRCLSGNLHPGGGQAGRGARSVGRRRPEYVPGPAAVTRAEGAFWVLRPAHASSRHTHLPTVVGSNSGAAAVLPLLAGAGALRESSNG